MIISTERPKIEIGYRVGMLTVIEWTQQKKSRYSVWHCRCDCGNICTASLHQLRSGCKKSCGCLNRLMFQNLSENIFYKEFLE